jgi:hypothetical protein
MASPLVTGWALGDLLAAVAEPFVLGIHAAETEKAQVQEL